ncbi:MAG: phage portal protein [Hyphomonadaceae bacterium]
MSDDRRRRSGGSFGARLRAAASVLLTGAVPGGRYGPNVPASEWNNRFTSFDDVHVDERTALNVSAVYACASLIADTMSQLPIGVFKRDGDTRETVPEHPVNRMLSGAVNDYQGRRALVRVAEAHRQLRGNAYLQVERDSTGAPVGLWPLGNATPKRREDGKLVYEVGSGDARQELPPADVVHVRGLSTSSNGLVGISPVAAAENAIRLGIYAEKFGSEFYKNESVTGGYILHPGKLTDVAKRNIREAVENQRKNDAGDKESHRLKIFEEGMKFVPTTIPPEQSQFLGSRAFQLEEIARWYRVPLVLIQSVEKTTSWGTGVEQLLIAFSSFTISPLAMSWEEELTLKLLTQEEREQGLYCRLDVRGLMRGDSASRAAYYASGIQNRWLLPNEVRAREELDPLPGGDAFDAAAKPTIE